MSGIEMGSRRWRGYTALMRSAWILVASTAWSCGDGEDLKLDVSASEPAGTGGAGTDAGAGAGGAPEEPVFTGGSPGKTDFAPMGGSVAAADPASGGMVAEPDGPVLAGGVPNSAPHSPPGVTCFDPADCDDGLYCNGDEVCEPWIRGSDVKVCKASLHGPCYPSECDEEEDECDCSDPDNDDDDYLVRGCTDSLYDCDDTDRWRNPGLPEQCSLDDPWHDEDCRETTYGARDEDKDLFYDSRCANIAFHQSVVPSSEEEGGAPAFSVALEVYSGNDCDDTLGNVKPGAQEVCDGRDNDCDGSIDEVFGETSPVPVRYYRDADGDTFGNPDDVLESLCPNPPPDYVRDHDDCDDTTKSIAPDLAEECNGIDDDCDGTVDEPFTPGSSLLGKPFERDMTFECGGADGWLVTSCPPDRLECSNPSYRDACETIGTTMCNCHECGAACNFSCGEKSCEEITDVSLGVSHTCAIARPNGDPNAPGSVACWGWNGYGQLGDGTNQDSSIPIVVEDLSRATEIATGESHTCAVANGAVYCWGWNGLGQVGYRTSVESISSPIAVPPPYEGAVARRLVSGGTHSCAIYDEGTLACWGAGGDGQLGDGISGEQAGSENPRRVRRMVGETIENVDDTVQVVAGAAHTCSLSSIGVVECWGNNGAGQIGMDPQAVPFASLPEVVRGLDDIAVDELSAAGFLTCARAGGEVRCWGSNYDHALASEGQEFSFAPTRITLPGAARSVAVGDFFGCAALADGAVYCWGTNLDGVRGSNDDAPSVSPSRVETGHATRLFAGGGGHICALTVAGAWCWGRNGSGQLGDGVVSEQGTPEPRRVHTLDGSRSCSNP